MRSAALRRDVFSLLNDISIGFRSGEYCRQIAKLSAALFNRLADRRSFVGRKIVEDDDIVALKRRSQALLDIGQKLGRVH